MVKPSPALCVVSTFVSTNVPSKAVLPHIFVRDKVTSCVSLAKSHLSFPRPVGPSKLT